MRALENQIRWDTAMLPPFVVNFPEPDRSAPTAALWSVVAPPHDRPKRLSAR